VCVGEHTRLPVATTLAKIAHASRSGMVINKNPSSMDCNHCHLIALGKL
jgi:hypothetical protein